MKNIFLSLLLLSNLFSFAQELIPYRLDNKWGYADNTGQLIIKPEYDKARMFSADGYAFVYKDNLCAVIDKSGKIIIPFKYTEILSFSEGLAAACKGGEYYWLQGEIVNGEWGYINTQGEEVIPFKYYRAEDFNNGYAIVQNKDNWGNWGLIDKNGKQILPFKYNTYSFDMRPFPGLKWDENEKGKLLYRPGQDDEVWRQIDLKGNLTGKKVDDIHGFSNNGDGNYTESKNGKYALLDSKHKPLSNYIYRSGIYFYEYYTFAKISIDSDKKDSVGNFIPSYGIIDNKGKIILPCIYHSIEINNGYITLENQDGKYAIADSTGKIITDWKNENLEYLGEGIYKSILNKNQIELFQLNGEKIKTPILSDSKYKFSEGLLGVSNEKNKWGYINSKGDVIIDFKYDYIDFFKNGFAEVDMNKNQYKTPDEGFINKQGIEFFKNSPGIFPKYNNGQTSIVDEYERVIEDNLGYAKKLNDGKILYKDQNSHYQIIDWEGKKYIHHVLVDLFPFTVYDLDPDKPSFDYFIGYAKDSTYIYDAQLNQTYCKVKDVDFRAFEMMKDIGLLFKIDKDGMCLIDLKGNHVTKKYKSIYRVFYGYFIAEKMDGTKGYIKLNDQIIIPFSKNNLFVDNENVIISSTFSGKKLTNVDFYDFNGKKINTQKITNYRKQMGLPGFYTIENSSAKKIGYLYQNKSTDFIYDNIEIKYFSGARIIIIKENNLYTLYDSNLEKLKGPYQEIISASNFITYKENNAYGLIEFNKTELIDLLPAKFESIPPFRYQRKAEIIAVKLNGKFIFVNTKGEKVIDKEFEEANQFERDYTKVMFNGKYGYINKDGSWLIEPKYDDLNDEITEDSKPCFYGVLNDKPVFLNELGENKLSNEVTFLDLYYFESGPHFMVMNKENKMGIYGLDGFQKTPLKYDEILTVYTETNEGEFMLYQARIGKKYAFLNMLGTEITDFVYDRIEYDDDSYITGWLGAIEVKQNGKYGLMDFEGKTIQPCEFDYFDWYFESSEEIFHYPAKRKGKWGLIGNKGQLLVETIYDKIYVDEKISEYFRRESNLMHYNVVLNGKSGIIDEKGNVIIPCEYKNIYFNYDCDYPSLELMNGKKRGIYASNKVVLAPNFDRIFCEFGTDGHYYIAQTKKKYQFYRGNGELLNQQSYDYYEWDGVNYIATVQRNKTSYFLNFDGTETLVEE